MQRAIILTGASRGLGQALASQLLEPDHHLICLSRSRNDSLAREAADKEVKLDWVTIDLNEVDLLEERIRDIIASIDLSRLDSIYLINNAGVLQPIGPVENNDGVQIADNIRINLIAPMIITSSFIQQTRHLKIDKRILNISSGAGKKTYYGWSGYCTSKAGLDHFTRCVGAEQEELEHGVKIVSVAPGVVDTDMQAEIRASKEEDFKQVQRFIDYKKQGLLYSPEEAAAKLLKVLLSESFPNGQVMDVRDLE
ncbi:3-ketoacyl-ACP reductase [Chlamydia abortus]|uniref:(S)-benzoin forming benzil reductase n=1 Tax=Paenibacillus sp. SAFN-117 TaxID=3436860 RepID=UPI000A27D201|nr:3-ketoacyl-ACP reductase [Chlamydia abortus]